VARGGLEPPTPRFSVVGRPALTRSTEGTKKWPFAGIFDPRQQSRPAVLSTEISAVTGGYRGGLCRDAGVGGTNSEVGLVAQRSGMVCRLAALVMACSYACFSSLSDSVRPGNRDARFRRWVSRKAED
jgi:hypothetical protein